MCATVGTELGLAISHIREHQMRDGREGSHSGASASSATAGHGHPTDATETLVKALWSLRNTAPRRESRPHREPARNRGPRNRGKAWTLSALEVVRATLRAYTSDRAEPRPRRG